MGSLETKANLFILSGPREIGKTTFLTSVVEQARQLQLTVAGVLSVAVYDAVQKVAIDVIDLHTGIKQRLANQRQAQFDGIATERWAFDAGVLAWGNQILAESCPCDLLIVDELGPIELERGGGWQNGIAALSSGDYRAAVVVIRPELLAKANMFWPQAHLLTIEQKPDPESSQKSRKILEL